MRKSGLIVSGLLVVVCAVLGFAIWQYRPMIVVGAGYKAKILCSGVFVSKRPESDVLAEDLYVDGFEALRFIYSKVDRNAETVTASLLGFWKRVAVYREGLGCTLAVDTSERVLRAEVVPAYVREDIDLSKSEYWPMGSRADLDEKAGDADSTKLRSAMRFAFSEPNPNALQRTRAVVVVYRGRIIAERYAKGYNKTTSQIGWSMSKSTLNSLIGVAMENQEVAEQLNQPLKLPITGLLPAWRSDDRSSISLNHLMQMSSGLAFEEDYADYESDVLRMLFAVGNKGAFAANKKAVANPGTRWVYSSGTSNIVSYILRRKFKAKADYLALAKRYLFVPLGMRSAVIEPDGSGTLIASSFMYASARDWARLGLLYLRDGDWFGRRILPKGWVSRSLEPAMGSPDKAFGLHLWLELPDALGNHVHQIPDDAFFMLGHAGQIVAIIPSRELVIVRLGLARKHGSWRPEQVVGAIVAAFPEKH